MVRDNPSSREKPRAAVLSRRTLAIFLLGLFVRALYLVESHDNPAFDVPIIDAFQHVDLARRIAASDGHAAERQRRAWAKRRGAPREAAEDECEDGLVVVRQQGR